MPWPTDEVWRFLHDEASTRADDSWLGPLLRETILWQRELGEAVSTRVAEALATPFVSQKALSTVLVNVVRQHRLNELFAADLHALRSRDQTVTGYLTPFVFSKAFHGLAAYRMAHALVQEGETDKAQYLQHRISVACGMDIHPKARLAGGIAIDHGTGIVIGETAIVEEGVFLLHGVTLGSTGRADGDRHPKVREGAFIGAAATILGNIEIGSKAVVAAGSVVLRSVPPGMAVAGSPAKIIGEAKPVLPPQVAEW